MLPAVWVGLVVAVGGDSRQPGLGETSVSTALSESRFSVGLVQALVGTDVDACPSYEEATSAPVSRRGSVITQHSALALLPEAASVASLPPTRSVTLVTVAPSPTAHPAAEEPDSTAGAADGIAERPPLEVGHSPRTPTTASTLAFPDEPLPDEPPPAYPDLQDESES
jgi:hypothetical protein